MHYVFGGRLFSRKKTPGGHAGGLAKWGGITKIGFYMSKIPKCRLETYWANKEVFTCSKFQNVIWKPTGLTKSFLHAQNPKMSFGDLQTRTKRFLKTTLFYGPKAPGAHRAHILLVIIFISLFY